MSSKMPLVVIGILLAFAPAAAWAQQQQQQQQQQTHELSEQAKAGDCFRHTLEMKLTGEMRFLESDAKPVKVKLSAAASHAFAERVLVAEEGQVKKCARVYET